MAEKHEPVDLEDDGYPDVFEKIASEHHVIKKPEDNTLLVMGSPKEEIVDGMPIHDCDEMGCPSAGSHVLYRCTIDRGLREIEEDS